MNFVSKKKVISFEVGLSQLHFLLVFVMAEGYMLTHDICVIISHQLLLVVAVFVMGLVGSTIDIVPCIKIVLCELFISHYLSHPLPCIILI